MTWTKAEVEEARKDLRERCPKGTTVYTILRHCSRSGMYRVLDLYIVKDNCPVRITYTAAAALEGRYDKRHEGLAMSGCGMDMGFAAVYDLASVLHTDGYALDHRWM